MKFIKCVPLDRSWDGSDGPFNDATLLPVERVTLIEGNYDPDSELMLLAQDGAWFVCVKSRGGLADNIAEAVIVEV